MLVLSEDRVNSVLTVPVPILALVVLVDVTKNQHDHIKNVFRALKTQKHQSQSITTYRVDRMGNVVDYELEVGTAVLARLRVDNGEVRFLESAQGGQHRVVVEVV